MIIWGASCYKHMFGTIRNANEYPQHVFMENWRTLSQTWQQILFLYKSSG